MAKRGRTGAYETRIEPYFEQIKKWVSDGATEREIAKQLGVSYSTFNKYKKEKKEFSELLKNARAKPVEEIKKALYKRAIGFYSEEETIVEEDGPKGHRLKVTATKRYYPPDPASCLMLLKHWARDEGWTGDPQMLEIKKKEVELKERKIEAEEF